MLKANGCANFSTVWVRIEMGEEGSGANKGGDLLWIWD
jgi:hypothetical protein